MPSAVSRQPSAKADNYELRAEGLNVMSDDWVAELHQAAIQVDADLIFQLVDQILPIHTVLAQGLAELARNFCFDEIVELTHHFCFDEILDLTQKDSNEHRFSWN